MSAAGGRWRVEPSTDPAIIDAVMRVDRESFHNPWTREMYEAELRNAAVTRLFVLRADDAVVAGYCLSWFVAAELHINNLAVHPAYRRQGGARTLLSVVLDEAARAGVTQAVLEVRRSNEAARHLYASFGFHLSGVRRDYYSAPVEDALVLRRNLEPPQAMW